MFCFIAEGRMLHKTMEVLLKSCTFAIYYVII